MGGKHFRCRLGQDSHLLPIALPNTRFLPVLNTPQGGIPHSLLHHWHYLLVTHQLQREPSTSLVPGFPVQKLWRNVCTARYWKKQDSISKTQIFQIAT